MARIVRAGEASSEAERRNEGSTKCVRNPEKREFAMQTRDEKMLCISRFFCEAKSHPKNKIQHDIYINHREKCNECWARYLCGGTCLYASYKAKGNHLRIDPIECTIKKHMAERCMKLIVFLYEHNIPVDKVL